MLQWRREWWIEMWPFHRHRSMRKYVDKFFFISCTYLLGAFWYIPTVLRGHLRLNFMGWQLYLLYLEMNKLCRPSIDQKRNRRSDAILIRNIKVPIYPRTTSPPNHKIVTKDHNVDNNAKYLEETLQLNMICGCMENRKKLHDQWSHNRHSEFKNHDRMAEVTTDIWTNKSRQPQAIIVIYEYLLHSQSQASTIHPIDRDRLRPQYKIILQLTKPTCCSIIYEYFSGPPTPLSSWSSMWK